MLSGFAYGRSETSPNSEQIEHTVAKPQMRNSVSVEQIQDLFLLIVKDKHILKIHQNERNYAPTFHLKTQATLIS
ncbi:hypothetical protein IJ541_07910 [bacterium]|nr:hypothetical protein [bacterium]